MSKNTVGSICFYKWSLFMSSKIMQATTDTTNIPSTSGTFSQAFDCSMFRTANLYSFLFASIGFSAFVVAKILEASSVSYNNNSSTDLAVLHTIHTITTVYFDLALSCIFAAVCLYCYSFISFPRSEKAHHETQTRFP